MNETMYIAPETNKNRSKKPQVRLKKLEMPILGPEKVAKRGGGGGSCGKEALFSTSISLHYSHCLKYKRNPRMGSGV